MAGHNCYSIPMLEDPTGAGEPTELDLWVAEQEADEESRFAADPANVLTELDFTAEDMSEVDALIAAHEEVVAAGVEAHIDWLVKHQM